ncbi:MULTISPECIES: hypothetical protein [Bacteroidales]|jgi:hypothetical protein|uniref:hypothetical protein n=1 Tax=Bacteroidales TaxID=171549 RepID=UPI0001EB55BD|nr:MULTISPECIES: hypothetical protein [Bacteroidales]MBK1775764.1 hypothetical protein [Escherichia coli]EFR57261.1 hypothetical protein HMPREF9720_1370 [Alistipes sp. HGB5]MBL1047920.1 hypothetical protein [Escherichia coli]MBS6299084.1 hypothetical protein [Alistipes sp.]MBV4296023.1 hypothetical protein [Alistipes shahii]
MKKIIFAVISLTLFVSCRIFHTTEPTNSAHWYVKNMTWKPIVIKKRDFRTERLLNPGDSISVFHRLPMQKLGFPSFDLFYELWNVNGNGVEQNLDVLSENGQLLKTWKISDKNDPSVRIFQETSWRFYQKPQLQHVSTCEVAWVFDILPADIE